MSCFIRALNAALLIFMKGMLISNTSNSIERNEHRRISSTLAHHFGSNVMH